MVLRFKNIASILILIPILIGLTSSSTFAQIDERTIKLSGDYYWGVGFGENRESAVSNAKRDLIERMIVRIESESSLRETDDNRNYQIELETTTNTLSRMELRGLNYLPAERKRNDSWESIAYISKIDYDASINTLKERLLSSLRTALQNERLGKLDLAIPQYMDILASSYFSPVPFYTTLEDHMVESELRSFLKNKINNWVYGLEIEQERVRSLSTEQNSEFYLDLLFTYGDIETSHLEITHNKPGFAAHPIRNGRTSIFYDLPPDQKIQSFVFTISPIIPENMDSELEEILDPLLPVREVNLDIDFSEVIYVDFFVVQESEYVFRLIPEIENLSVYKIEWMFDGASSSNLTSPIYEFNSDYDEVTISFIVNNSKELTRTKTLSASGAINDSPKSYSQNMSEVVHSTSSTTESLNSHQVGFSIPDSLKMYFDTIIRTKDGESLSNYLSTLQNSKVLEFGRKTDVSDPIQSFLAVINPRNRRIQELLSPIVDGYRFSLISSQSIPETQLTEEFQGLGSIWFQFR